MDHIYFSIVYTFTKPGFLDDAFIKVGLSSDWGTLSPSKDERICDKYGSCIVPFYKCVIFTMPHCLPFTTFEIQVLKHLAMAPSQLHPSYWVYLKVY